jgi:hypothetical protein
VHYDVSNPAQPVEMEIEGTPRIVIGSSADGPVRPCVEILTSRIANGEGLVGELAALPQPLDRPSPVSQTPFSPLGWTGRVR